MDMSPASGRYNRNSGFWDPFSSGNGSIFDPPGAFPVFGRPFSGRDIGGSMAGTRVDWVETPQAHVFKADIPVTHVLLARMNKEEVKVEVLDGRTLSIGGFRNEEIVKEKDSWRCVERSHGKFSRQFVLPENAKVSKVAAKVENGVLTVTVPKTKKSAPRVRSIEIQ